MQAESKPNNSTKNNLYNNDITNQEIGYFIVGAAIEVNREVSAKTTLKIHEEYSSVFTGIGCFKGSFSLHLKDVGSPWIWNALPSNI